MSTWKIYHNPKCSKSRLALAFLKERGIYPEVVEYLKTPIDEIELQKIVGLLQRPIGEIVRTKEDAYRADAFDLQNQSLVLQKLASNLKLLERPIVVNGNKAVIGRPTENILNLLE